MSNGRLLAIGLAIAAILGYFAFAANRLPAELKKQIETEQRLLDNTKSKVSNQRAAVAKEAAAAPELFRVRGFDTEWPGQFGEAQAKLTEADRYAANLHELSRKDRKSSRPQVEDLLRRERESEKAALAEADGVVAEAQKRVDLKRDFAQTLSRLDGRAQSLEKADYSSLEAQIDKAERDWPSRKGDLVQRLSGIEQPKQEAAEWEQTIHDLEAKPAASLTADDYAQAFDVEEAVDGAPSTQQATELAALTQQLYTSWDNVLEDLDKEHDQYRERVKHVLTTVSSPEEKGVTTSRDQWIDVSPPQWQVVENDIGMTVEHKPFGRFDSEADKTPQPAGFAYMASPEQGRNQYGYWEQRDGGSFWHWLPEYLILSSLLSNHYYQPIPSYDWYHYRDARQYGRTYYGQDVSGAPKYGSHGTFTQRSYASSRYVQSGGFSGSKYASGGGFAGSKYGNGSPSASAPNSGQRFGSSSSSSAPRRFGSSSTGQRFGSSSRSAGRSFGGRRH